MYDDDIYLLGEYPHFEIPATNQAAQKAIENNAISRLTIKCTYPIQDHLFLERDFNSLKRALEKNASLISITIDFGKHRSFGNQDSVNQQKPFLLNKILPVINNLNIYKLDIKFHFGNSNLFLIEGKTINDFFFSHLPKSLHQLSITDLELSSDIQHITNLIMENKIAHLRLKDIGINDSHLTKISAALIKNTNLLTLDLSHNLIGPIGLSSLEKALEKHPRILEVNLEKNIGLIDANVDCKHIKQICLRNLNPQYIDETKVEDKCNSMTLIGGFLPLTELWRTFLPENTALEKKWANNSQHDWAKLCATAVELAAKEVKKGKLTQIQDLFEFLAAKRFLIALILNQEEHANLFCRIKNSNPSGEAREQNQAPYIRLRFGLTRKVGYTFFSNTGGPYINPEQFDEVEKIIQNLANTSSNFHKVVTDPRTIRNTIEELGFPQKWLPKIFYKSDQSSDLLKLIVIYGDIINEKGVSERIPLTASVCYRDEKNIGHLYLFHAAPERHKIIFQNVQIHYAKILQSERIKNPENFLYSLRLIEFYLSHAMPANRGSAAILKMLRQVIPVTNGVCLSNGDKINTDILAMLTPNPDEFAKDFANKISPLPNPNFQQSPSMHVGFSSKFLQSTLQLIRWQILDYEQALLLHPLQFYLLETQLLDVLARMQRFSDINIQKLVSCILQTSFDDLKSSDLYIQKLEGGHLIKPEMLTEAIQRFRTSLRKEIYADGEKFKAELIKYLTEQKATYKQLNKFSSFFSSFPKEQVYLAELVTLINQGLETNDHVNALREKITSGINGNFTEELKSILEKYDSLISYFHQTTVLKSEETAKISPLYE